MHKCEALVISCIDFRFQEHLRDFLNKRHFHSYDLVCVAGAAKSFHQSKIGLNFLLKQIKISNRLHAVQKIYLINHQNCGAYGPSLKSGSLTEKNVHGRDLKEAAQMIKKALPQLKVHLYFMNFKKDPIKKVNFTEIR